MATHSATCAVCQRSLSRTDARAVLCRRRALHASCARSLKPARPTTAALLRAHLNAVAAGATRAHRLLRQLDRRSRVNSTLLVAALHRLLAPHPAGAAYRCRSESTRGYLECASVRASSCGWCAALSRARATSPRTEVKVRLDAGVTIALLVQHETSECGCITTIRLIVSCTP